MKTVQPRRLQGPLALGASIVLIGSAALAQSFTPGTKVQASPTAMDGYWQDCLVVGPGANGTHQLNCAANPYRDQSFVWVQDKWIRPAGDAPAAAPQAQAAAPPPPPQAPPQAAPAPRPAAGNGQAYAAGDKVQASPTAMDGYWQDCLVVGPGANGTHQLNCAANPYRDQSFVWVQDKWIRPAGDAPAAAPAPPAGAAAMAAPPRAARPAQAAAANAAALAGADPFPVGSTVLASPDQMDGQWQRCVVQTAADAYGYHKLACANQHAGAHDEVVNTVTQTAAPTKWMKPDDPAFRPDMQLAAAKPAAPALPAARPADGPAARVAQGAYQCWSSNRANLLLNFTVTGPGQYRASDGSAGTFAFDPASKAMRFTGYINEVLPAGFSALYHEPKGLPTVSFQARGGEAAFCEKV